MSQRKKSIKKSCPALCRSRLNFQVFFHGGRVSRKRAGETVLRGIPPPGSGGYMRRAMAVPERQPSLHERLKEINYADFSNQIGITSLLLGSLLLLSSARPAFGAAYSKDALERLDDAVAREFPDKSDAVYEGARKLQKEAEGWIYSGKITSSNEALPFLQARFSHSHWTVRAAALRLAPHFLDGAGSGGGDEIIRQALQAAQERFSPGSSETHPFCLTAAFEAARKILRSDLSIPESLISDVFDGLIYRTADPRSNSYVVTKSFNAQADILAGRRGEPLKPFALKTLSQARETIKTGGALRNGQSFALSAAALAAQAALDAYRLPEELVFETFLDFLDISDAFISPLKTARKAINSAMARMKLPARKKLAPMLVGKIEQKLNQGASSRFQFMAFHILRSYDLWQVFPSDPQTARKTAFLLARGLDDPDQSLAVIRALSLFLFQNKKSGGALNAAAGGEPLSSESFREKLLSGEKTGFMPLPAAGQGAGISSAGQQDFSGFLTADEKAGILKQALNSFVTLFEYQGRSADQLQKAASEMFVLMKRAFQRAEPEVQTALKKKAEELLKADLSEEDARFLIYSLSIALSAGHSIDAESAGLVAEYGFHPGPLGQEALALTKRILPSLPESDRMRIGLLSMIRGEERRRNQNLVDERAGENADQKTREEAWAEIADSLARREEAAGSECKSAFDQ